MAKIIFYILFAWAIILFKINGMRKLIVSAVLLFVCCYAFSQKKSRDYSWGIGAKYMPIAISVKKYNQKGDAVEVLFSKYDEGVRITGLLELCTKLNESGSVAGIFGVGAHGGLWDSKIKKNTYVKNPIIGFDAIVGLEYKMSNTPIVFQIDYQPSIEIGNSDTFRSWGGLTVRYSW